MNLRRAFALLLAGSLSCGAQAADAPTPADLVVVDASIVTMVPGAPRAAALAVRGDRIVAVGTEAEIRALAGPATRVLDLDGRLVTPGFIEGHGHFMSLGECARAARPAQRRQLGRHRRPGPRRRGCGAAGGVDPRRRLAPGEVVVAA